MPQLAVIDHMGWKDTCAMEERFRFIEDWKRQEENLAELCRRYGVSRKTGYKWLLRYEEGGVEGLRDQSRAPHTHPHAVRADVVDAIVAGRGEHPTWGPDKLRAWLQREQPDVPWPAVSTMGDILQRHGLTILRKRRRHAAPNTQPLADAVESNRVWCTDFKGWFPCRDGTMCYPLTLSDAFSRYLLRCQALASIEAWRTVPIYEAAFREYGLPDRMRSDNGPPFASAGLAGLSALSVRWIKLGIRPERIAPGKPEQNGRHERMHLTLQQDVVRNPAANLRAQQQQFDQFRHMYNEQRPHAALQQQTPASVYTASTRPYPARLPAIEYPATYVIRRVDQSGQIRWRNLNVYTSRALAGEWVGLEAIAESRWRVYFSFYELGEFIEGNPRVQESGSVSEGADA